MRIIFNKQGLEMLAKMPRPQCSVCLLPQGDGLPKHLKQYQYETCSKCGNSINLNVMLAPLAYKVRWVNHYNKVGLIATTKVGV